ncbi:MAG: hypothetical protein B5M53_10270 [Candidatus Cloacimonas sp. 4484_209]|nr:MAG: hypothetical protein B5M53_10270 [Candidatus Cloacimonas sp. 4484_209]
MLMEISNFLRKNRRILILVFLTAFVFRLIFSLPVLFDTKRAFGPGGDARNYASLAKHLLTTHQFGSYPEGIKYREAARTPGYPLFIAFSYLLSGNRNWFVILFQCLLDSLVASMLFSIALIILHNVRAGLIAGMLYSIHPHQMLYTTQMLTEGLFTFLLVVFFILFIKSRRKLFLILSGILLGIATLTRPITFYFFIPVVLVLLYGWRKKLRVALNYSFLFVVVFFLTLSPWYVRNYITFHRVFLSTIGNWNVGYYNAAFVISFQKGLSLRQAQTYIGEEVKKFYGITDADFFYATDNPKISAEVASYGLKVIRRNLATYSLLHFAGFLNSFVPSEYSFLYKVMGRDRNKNAEELSPVSKSIIVSSLKTKVRSSIAKLVEIRFKKFPVWFTIIWVAICIFEFFIYFFAVKGSVYLFGVRKNIFILFVLGILYFTLIPGPVGDPRFRVPIEPAIVLLAAAGLFSVHNI